MYHCAVGLTRLLLCRGCIDEGADVNARDLWDSVPLYYACKTGKHALAVCFILAPLSWILSSTRVFPCMPRPGLMRGLCAICCLLLCPASVIHLPAWASGTA